jgi:hypothetical protein
VNVVVGSGPLGWQVNGILAVVVNALVYMWVDPNWEINFEVEDEKTLIDA